MSSSKACTVPVYLSACVHTGSRQLVALHWKDLDATPSMRPGDGWCGVRACCARRHHPCCVALQRLQRAAAASAVAGVRLAIRQRPLLLSGCVAAGFKVHGGWRMVSFVQQDRCATMRYAHNIIVVRCAIRSPMHAVNALSLVWLVTLNPELY